MGVLPARRVSVAVASAVVASVLTGCGGRAAAVWTLPNGDLAGTRAAAGSRIDAGNVAHLRVRWRFRFMAKPSFSGIVSSNPIVDEHTVYVQDLRSNVFALDRSTGAQRWARRYGGAPRPAKRRRCGAILVV